MVIHIFFDVFCCLHPNSKSKYIWFCKYIPKQQKSLQTTNQTNNKQTTNKQQKYLLLSMHASSLSIRDFLFPFQRYTRSTNIVKVNSKSKFFESTNTKYKNQNNTRHAYSMLWCARCAPRVPTRLITQHNTYLSGKGVVMTWPSMRYCSGLPFRLALQLGSHTENSAQPDPSLG